MRKIDLNNFHVATSETARDINRRIVLNLIRQHQPISRADLARQSGLQRSTVSLITEQLIRERWVREGAIGATPRGRRPRFLHLNKERIGIIGVDIRPVQTMIALAGLDAQFMAQESLPTGGNPEKFIAELGTRIKALMKAHPEITYEGIGISLPGRVDLATGHLVFAPNLKWGPVDIQGPIEAATGLPVELENAANACVLAEMWFGRRTGGKQNLLAITVSEGVGGGLILNGQIVRGSTGAAGEFGHATLVEDGLPCRCGNRGCWEVYASNTAALRYYQESLPGKRGKQSEVALTFEDLLELVGQGAPKAGEAIDQMAHHLGAGLTMLITGLAPDVILIVGEITRVWDRVHPIVEKMIKARCHTHAAPRLLPTDPAAQPRLRGTIALVLQKHFGAPSVA